MKLRITPSKKEPHIMNVRFQGKIVFRGEHHQVVTFLEQWLDMIKRRPPPITPPPSRPAD